MIQIPKATFEDAGEYACTANNKIGRIEHTITVGVKGETFRSVQYSILVSCCTIVFKLIYSELAAAPFWLEKPRDLILAPEENGRLVCRSDGAPRPTISWFINGEPIDGRFLEILFTSCTILINSGPISHSLCDISSCYTAGKQTGVWRDNNLPQCDCFKQRCLSVQCLQSVWVPPGQCICQCAS